MNNLAVLLNTQGRSEEAESLYRQSLAIKKKVLGEDHPSYLSSLNNMARVLEAQGKLSQAEAMLRQALKEKLRVLKEDHPATLIAMDNLASILAHEDKSDEAEALFRDVMARRQRVLGPDDRDTLQSMNNLAHLLALREKYDQAEPLYRQTIDLRQRVLGETNYYTVNSKGGLAQMYEMQRRWNDAELVLVDLCKPQTLAAQTPVIAANIIARYGVCLAEEKKFAEAEPSLLDAKRRLRDAGQPGSARMRDVLQSLANVYDSTARPDQAAKERAELSALTAASAPATKPAGQ